MKVVVSRKGRIALPAELREQDGIAPGQRFEDEGIVDWLLSCPEKGWFTPIDSEPTPIVNPFEA